MSKSVDFTTEAAILISVCPMSGALFGGKAARQVGTDGAGLIGPKLVDIVARKRWINSRGVMQMFTLGNVLLDNG